MRGPVSHRLYVVLWISAEHKLCGKHKIVILTCLVHQDNLQIIKTTSFVFTKLYYTHVSIQVINVEQK